MKKILLLGANGQVGSDIVAAKDHYAIDLIPCDRQTADITNKTQLSQIIHHHRPDAVINAAAYTLVDKAETEKDIAFAINTTGPEYLAEICNQLNIPLLHFSTDYIFDGKKDYPYSEDDHASPQGIYAQSKWLGEEAIRKKHSKHIILRVSWVFGKNGNNFVKTMLRLMEEKEQLNIVADQKGCPTYATDIAHAALQIILNPSFGTFHYCGQPATTWHGFASIIYEAIQSKHLVNTKKINAITTSEYPTPAKRPMNSILDCKKIKNTFNLECSNWKKGLIEMLALKGEPL
ncbi:MAG: dTDP-4-dehydrorhamnose reductase [Gammaproteobacteria bacterium]